MSKFYGMLSNDLRAQHAAKLAQSNANLSVEDEAIATEIIDKVAADNGITTDLFAREQVIDIIKARLDRERGLTAEQQLAHKQMMVDFQEDLAEHELPAKEILAFVQNLDLTTLDGLRLMVDDVISLGEIISEYAVRLSAEKAARTSMPTPKNADVLRNIFGLDG